MANLKTGQVTVCPQSECVLNYSTLQLLYVLINHFFLCNILSHSRNWREYLNTEARFHTWNSWMLATCNTKTNVPCHWMLLCHQWQEQGWKNKQVIRMVSGSVCQTNPTQDNRPDPKFKSSTTGLKWPNKPTQTYDRNWNQTGYLNPQVTCFCTTGTHLSVKSLLMTFIH